MYSYHTVLAFFSSALDPIRSMLVSTMPNFIEIQQIIQPVFWFWRNCRKARWGEHCAVNMSNLKVGYDKAVLLRSHHDSKHPSPWLVGRRRRRRRRSDQSKQTVTFVEWVTCHGPARPIVIRPINSGTEYTAHVWVALVQLKIAGDTGLRSYCSQFYLD